MRTWRNGTTPEADEASGPALVLRGAEHVLRVEPWGSNSVRVRAARRRIGAGAHGALTELPDPVDASLESHADGETLRVGELSVTLDNSGLLTFRRGRDGAELVREALAHPSSRSARTFEVVSDGCYRVEQRFAAYPGERCYGLGQHQHGLLDQKGCVIDLVQRNSEVTIPFLVSSRGYGMLWNNPGIGRVELAHTGTRWVADASRELDYWLTAGETPTQLLGQYADATGHAPDLPHWATGLWQSRLRYTDQAELVAVARGYADRGLPLSVIVVDYMHWPQMGDWRFDPAQWPDPAGMVEELRRLGVRVMVSVWPTASPLSENYDELAGAGLLVGAERGLPGHLRFGGGPGVAVSYYDATDPAARDYLWQKVKRNYYDHGIRLWWLDACEPEIFPEQFDNLRLAAGPGREVANIYPRDHIRGLYEHMREQGETEIVALARSAWAGSQRDGALLWSGDIPATFDALATQVAAGLNVAMSGLPWWTTDIGGFHGGDPDSADYRELMIRWFQYAVFCPVLRMHGHREPRGVGGPNELWSYGEQAYSILTAQLGLRERLRGYVGKQMQVASATGLPAMRPVFVDFPDDDAAWDVADQFMFGPDLLVAPVTRLGQRERNVYLPGGTRWTDPADGVTHDGGRTVALAAPLEHLPVLIREHAEVRGVFLANPAIVDGTDDRLVQ